jgi:hypothetical protein
MGSQRPDYLNHLDIRRQGLGRAEHACTVVLLPSARALVPRRFQRQIATTALDQVVELGIVTHHPSCSPGRWPPGRPTVWGYRCRRGQTRSGSYRSRRDAAESCAVEAIEGTLARTRFEADRWERRRPDDN